MQKKSRKINFYFRVSIPESVTILAVRIQNFEMKITRTVFLSLLIIVFSASCKTVTVVSKVETSQYIFSDTSNTSIDSTTYKFIAPYKATLDKTMNEQLAFTKTALVKSQPESALGDFSADACLSQVKKVCDTLHISNPDFLFLNSGGLRTSVPQGIITRRNIYEVMPFENELVILEMNGTTTNQLVSYIAARGGEPVSGLKMILHDKHAQNVEINSITFDSTKTYRVATSDYLANGGDNLDFLKDVKRINLNLKVRDAMINYLLAKNNSGDTLNIQTDGRIRKQ